LRFVAEHYLIVPVGALAAIVLANVAPDVYFRASQSLSFVVNDVGMAFVLAFIAQEVFEAMLPDGALYPPRRAALPALAALTGAIGAAGAYALSILSGDARNLLPGWRAVTAVDIGLCYVVVVSAFGRGGASAFALLLAIASDAIGLVLVSHGNTGVETRPIAVLLIVPALAVAAYLRSRESRTVWPYLLVPGVLSWVGLYAAGIHPALSLIPIVPFMPHSPRSSAASGRTHVSASHFEQVFRLPVQVIAALFGLVNGGVLIHGFDDGTWAVLEAAFIGRPVGILLGAVVGIGAGLHLPLGMRRRDLLVIAIAATPAFSFGLFFATAVFPDGPLLTEVKIGMMGSVAGALIALAFARLERSRTPR
jgi:NhaA family Na+:H+ antiporter